jgi:hypothetical protein
MAKTEAIAPKRVPVVTERTRKPREGFKNPNKGIEVAKGLNLQDVPRDMIRAHLKEIESLAKQRFQQRYGHEFGGQQSF